MANSRGFASILVWSNRQSLHRWHKCTRKGINLPQLTADSLKEPPKGLATKTYNQKSSWLRLHFSLAYQPHTKFNFLSPVTARSTNSKLRSFYGKNVDDAAAQRRLEASRSPATTHHKTRKQRRWRSPETAAAAPFSVEMIKQRVRNPHSNSR